MIIDRKNRQWSIDFVARWVSCPQGSDRIKDGLANHTIFYPWQQEDPYRIYTYQDMIDDDPYQDICKENEVVLSIKFVEYEEEIQILTYEQLEEIFETVLSTDKKQQ